MNFKSLLVALLATSVGFVANAETTTGETKVKVEGQNSVEGNIDNEITNARMRADSGSKSKYSASIDIGYSGGSLEDPGSEQRANLLGGNERPAVLMNIDAGLRYRLNKNESLRAGTGLTIIQPFHSTSKNASQDSYSDKLEASSPYLTYSNFRKSGDWMVSNSVTGSVATAKRDIDAGEVVSLSNTNSFLYDFKNGVQAGTYLSFGTTYFNDKGDQSNASDFFMNIDPFAEYAINDMFNLRTVLNLALYHTKYRGDRDLLKGSSKHWANGSVRHSFGLGIAATRDIFLYPNIQVSARDFYANASFENSTVGFSATINAF